MQRAPLQVSQSVFHSQQKRRSTKTNMFSPNQSSNLTLEVLEPEEKDFHVGYSHLANILLFTASFCINNIFGSFLIFCMDRQVTSNMLTFMGYLWADRF